MVSNSCSDVRGISDSVLGVAECGTVPALRDLVRG